VRDGKKRGGFSPWHLLLLLPFIATLWPPFYNKMEPTFIGLPFFYWFQLLWVFIAAACTWVVHLLTDE
jgi:hypothetical protein